MVKVSFDFDETLSRPEVQEYAKELIDQGIEVWVVTTRWDENHKHKYDLNPTINDLWEVTDRLGILRHHVRFTCMEWKHTYLTGTQFIWHLDDNPSEFSEAKMYKCNVPMIQVDENGWMLKCNRLLNNAINAIENGDVKQY